MWRETSKETRLCAADASKKTDARFFCMDRYEDVSTILKDDRFGTPNPPSEIHSLLRLLGLGDLARSAETGFLSSLNPPEHTQLRKIVEPFFQKQAVASLEPRIETIVEHLLDEVDGSKEFDLVADYATRLPSAVIAEIFGFPNAENEKLSRWANRIAPLVDHELRQSALVMGLIASFKLRRRILHVVRERNEEPKDDLLSALADAHYGELGITMDQLVGLAVFVFTAGQITIADLISSCLLQLLRSPEALAEVKKRPDAIERLVEETLRLNSPLQRTARVVTEDVVVNQETIPRGSPVRLMLGVANRDNNRFQRPDSLDLNRPNSRHLAFGAGRHFCLGLHLARLEVKLAVGAILRRFPDLTLASDELALRAGTKFHGLSELRLRTAK